MHENPDPLTQLWQNQTVEQADLAALSKKWRRVKYKQRAYVALDFGCLLLAGGIIALKFERLDPIVLALMSIVMLIGFASVLYVTWLRRFSLGWSQDNTELHIKNLQKQIHNNIKIAQLSKYSVWALLAFFAVFNALLFYFEIFPEAIFWQKFYLTLVINAVALPCLWIWANKRKKRFELELAELKSLLLGKQAGQ
ncbi:hypothetical protein [Paraglaciecola aestuariivivens]